MPAYAIGSGTISFGLVSIPIKLYTAASSQAVSFNLLHAKCGSRIKQQTFCPTCNEVVERSALVKGYEFVPLKSVGGDKAYRLLSDAMEKHERVALATFVMRGKESLVLVRAAQGGFMLHTMYFADEVRSFGEIEKGESAKIKEGEMELALQLIDGLSKDAFRPEQYQDEYRQHVLDLVNQKVEGREITTVGPQVQRVQVIDLMEALKQSLAERIEKKPLAKAKRADAPAPAKKAQAGKK